MSLLYPTWPHPTPEINGCLNKAVDCFYTALFSALEQTNWVLVACNSPWVTHGGFTHSLHSKCICMSIDWLTLSTLAQGVHCTDKQRETPHTEHSQEERSTWARRSQGWHPTHPAGPRAWQGCLKNGHKGNSLNPMPTRWYEKSLEDCGMEAHGPSRQAAKQSVGWFRVQELHERISGCSGL